MKEVSIFSSRTDRKLHNFWNHIHFHPTDAIEDLWGQKILRRIAAEKAAEYVRIYTMFEEMVSRDVSGVLQYDFSGFDARCDFLVRQNFQLLICYNFMPQCLASDCNALSRPRYKAKFINSSEPMDYSEWGEICRVFTAHLVERYGIEVVQKWYFHCWNEPDGHYWCANADLEGKLSAYCKLYDWFAEGISAVDQRLRFGGPVLAAYYSYLDGFLRHITQEKNWATGKIGTRCDFLSAHAYANAGQHIQSFRHPTAPENILDTILHYQNLLAKYDLARLPIIIDEWGAHVGGFADREQNPLLVFRESEFFAAFYARLIDLLVRQNRANLQMMMLCLSGQDFERKDFCGCRSFFTHHYFAKPIYNAFRIGARLGPELLAESDNLDSPYTGILPTACPDGRIAVLCYHFCDDLSAVIPPTAFRIILKQLKKKNYRMRHYRIDRQFSNGFAQWGAMGAPAELSQFEMERIARSAELTLMEPEEEIAVSNQEWSKELVLPQNAVSLIEMIPER